MKTCVICQQPLTGTARTKLRARKVHPGLKCREYGIEDRIEDVVQNLMKGMKK